MKLSQVFDWLDGIEVAVCAVIAVLLLIAAPVFLVVRFVATDHYLPATALGVLWCACVATCIHDFRSQAFRLGHRQFFGHLVHHDAMGRIEFVMRQRCMGGPPNRSVEPNSILSQLVAGAGAHLHFVIFLGIHLSRS